MAWELKGKYPHILKDPVVGKEASDLFAKAQAMLQRLITRQPMIQGRRFDGMLSPLQARGVYGFFPANRDGDDILIYTDESRTHETCRMPMLRQQWEREGQTSFRSLADYIAPVESGKHDFLGAFAVSTGFGVKELADAYKKNGDDCNAILVESLAERLAEAFAEYLHQK